MSNPRAAPDALGRSSHISLFAWRLAIALVAAILMPASLEARLTLRIIAGSTTVAEIEDQGPGDQSRFFGEVTWFGAAGDLSFGIVALSWPIDGSARDPRLSILVDNMGSHDGSTASVVIEATEYGIEAAPGKLVSSFAGATGGRIDLEFWGDTNGEPFGEGVRLAEVPGLSNEFNTAVEKAGFPVGSLTLRAHATVSGFVQRADFTARIAAADGTVAEAPSTLHNVSTRGPVSTGSSVLIGGFVIEGNGPRKMLLRGVGPDLEKFGVAGWLADPVLELYRTGGPGQEPLFTNDNWETNSNTSEIIAANQRVGAFPLTAGGNDAALLLSLEPGSYTVQVKGRDGASGLGLFEAYDADESSSTSRLINLSTRTSVSGETPAPIAGFVVTGDADRAVLLRAVGPALTTLGVPNAVSDPVLSLQRIAIGGAVLDVATNDNWSEASNAARIAEAAESIGAFPLSPDSKDAAIFLTLAPGSYTATVTGKDGSTGIALAEVYLLPQR